MLMCLTFSNLNSIHWKIKKIYRRPLCTFQDIFRPFQVNFQNISVTRFIFRIRIGAFVVLVSIFQVHFRLIKRGLFIYFETFEIIMQKSARMKKELEMLITSPPYGISCWPKDDRTDLLEARKYTIFLSFKQK